MGNGASKSDDKAQPAAASGEYTAIAMDERAADADTVAVTSASKKTPTWRPPTPAPTLARAAAAAVGMYAVMETVVSIGDRYMFSLSYDVLGEGSYGKVYRAIDTRQMRTTVALKRLTFDDVAAANRSDCLRERRSREVPCEAEALAYLQQRRRHPNIIRLLAVLREETTFHRYIAFELAHTTVATVCRDGGRACAGAVRRLARQLLSGVAFCARHDVVHGDIKPENLLLVRDANVAAAAASASPLCAECGRRSIWCRGDMTLKIADFGTARHAPPPSHLVETVTTRFYRPPEACLGMPYGCELDVWSAACVWIEMARGNQQPLFPGTNRLDTARRIFALRGTPAPDEWPEAYARDRVRRLLTTTAAARSPPSLRDALPERARADAAVLERMLVCNPLHRATAAEALRQMASVVGGVVVVEGMTAAAEVAAAETRASDVGDVDDVTDDGNE